MSDNEDLGRFASSPPFTPGTDHAGLVSDPLTGRPGWADVNRFRKAERERLLGQRLAVSAQERAEKARAMAGFILSAIGDLRGRIVSAYWPIRGEPDLRPLLEEVNRRGGRTALPVVVEKKHPLEFRFWQAGDKLERGAWGIPTPAVRTLCIPDIILAPVVGHDSDGFRLGYGGGYFDRTLAVLGPSPLVIGVGYEDARLATIYPQPHDIPMRMIVTECGISPASHDRGLTAPDPAG